MSVLFLDQRSSCPEYKYPDSTFIIVHLLRIFLHLEKRERERITSRDVPNEDDGRCSLDVLITLPPYSLLPFTSFLLFPVLIWFLYKWKKQCTCRHKSCHFLKHQISSIHLLSSKSWPVPTAQLWGEVPFRGITFSYTFCYSLQRSFVFNEKILPHEALACIIWNNK